jgi:hypothetical protein
MAKTKVAKKAFSCRLGCRRRFYLMQEKGHTHGQKVIMTLCGSLVCGLKIEG